METAETELNPKYERGTLANVYELIDKDLQAGLELVNDGIYTVAKYHFNQKAAYTFASRFYLFYGDWDKVIKYATLALGPNPLEYMRDYAYLTSLPRDYSIIPKEYNNSNQKTNFLIMTSYSAAGMRYLPYGAYDRFGHGTVLMQTEILNNAPWVSFIPEAGGYMYQYVHKLPPMMYIGTTYDTSYFQHTPYLFEYIDPVAGIGYRRCNLAMITAEEALLNRAEAYVMKKEYDKALADINLWTNNTLDPVNAQKKSKITVTTNLTQEIIENWAENTPYYSETTISPKKALNSQVQAVEAGTQEAFIHTVLIARRLEFIEMGMRWFDIKRHGIEIHRRIVKPSGDVTDVTIKDVLTVNDPRRAIQLPQDVITAGLTPNVR